MIEQLAEMPTYEAYKDSGVEWLGEIPEHWNSKKIKFLFYIGRGRVISQQELDELGSYPVYSSQTKDNGILGYINSFDFDCSQITWTTDGANAGTVFLRHGKHNCTNVCGTLQPKNSGFSIKFISHGLSVAAQYYKRPDTNGAKIMNGEMAEIFVPLPPITEQTAIAAYLNSKTAHIDQAVAIKEQQIALLKEHKQILIQNAVTRGLDHNVPMRESGVEWIGKMPVHWEIRRSKYVFTQRKEFARKDDIQLSATQAYGVIPQDEYESKIGRKVVKIQFHLEKRKHVEIDDFVISMRSFQGGLERAWSVGCIRSSYIVLRPSDEVDPNYYSYLFKSSRYISALQSTANFIRDGQDLNFENFAMVDLMVLPLDEQKKIASYLDNQITLLDKANELLHHQIDKLKEYKATLINSAVTGKIKIA